MLVDLSKAVGYEYPVQPTVWNKRDLIIYALGIGATKDDFTYIYEQDKNFAAFPTYPVVLPFKLNNTDVTNFRELISGDDRGVPGLPNFDPDRIVHGSQFIEIIRPLPTVSKQGWKLNRKLVGVHENKSGIVVDIQTTLVDPSGTPYTRMFSSTFHVGAKAHSKPFNKVIAAAPVAKTVPKDRKPDYVFTQEIPDNQAVIYRLSGDYNGLHVEPSIGKAAGFGGPILHGLSSLGFVARGILAETGGNDPHALKGLGARFTSPVKLGDKLETSVWEFGKGPDGITELAFITKNLNSGKLSLGAGVAFIKKTEKARL